MSPLANHILNIIGIILVIWSEFEDQILPMVSPKYRHVITLAIAICMYIKSHENLLATPPGKTETEALKKSAGAQ